MLNMFSDTLVGQRVSVEKIMCNQKIVIATLSRNRYYFIILLFVFRALRFFFLSGPSV